MNINIVLNKSKSFFATEESID